MTANGELATQSVGLQKTTYQYDILGNLVSVTLPNGKIITYVVDAEERRVGKKVNGALMEGFLYDGDRIVAQMNASNAVVSQFVYGSSFTTPDYMVSGGTTYRIVTDQLGSPRLVVNTATGAIAERIDYDEFGNVLNDTNPGFQPFGFAGGLYDQDTKLVRFGARDYDPTTGRWTAKDPTLFAGGDANLYGYVMNDPVNRIDPTGLADADIYVAYVFLTLGTDLYAANVFAQIGATVGEASLLPFRIADAISGGVLLRGSPVLQQKTLWQMTQGAFDRLYVSEWEHLWEDTPCSPPKDEGKPGQRNGSVATGKDRVLQHWPTGWPPRPPVYYGE